MKVNYLTLGGQRHPVCFSLGAGEELVEKCGVDLSELPDMARSPNGSTQWTPC